jgi:hypothetical protein
MPRQTKITRTINGGPKCDFTVTYGDDTPERAEAVAFFAATERGLFPAMNLPSVIDDLPRSDAQAYLDQHPIQEQWSMLTIGQNDNVSDDDLSRLQHISELDTLKLCCGTLTDAGLQHLKWLTSLELLVVACPNVTDACLAYLIPLRSLRHVDFQLSPNVTVDAYMETMDRLPNIQDRYPPFPRDWRLRKSTLN